VSRQPIGRSRTALLSPTSSRDLEQEGDAPGASPLSDGDGSLNSQPEVEFADLMAAARVVGRILAGPGAGSGGFHVADELVFQSVPGSVRGSPNRGRTLASKPVTAVMRSPAIVTTSSP
jgi:hypothetical protein